MRHIIACVLFLAFMGSPGHSDDWIEFEDGGNLYVYDIQSDAYYLIGPVAVNPVGTPAGPGANGSPGYTWGNVIYGPPAPPGSSESPPDINTAAYWNWYWYWFGWAAGED